MSELYLHRIENHWKTKITASNELFDKEKFKEALVGYKEALYNAEALNNYPLDCMNTNIPFIHMYIISCNNLANTHIELEQSEKGEKMLKRVVYYLLNLANKEYTNIGEIQCELKRAYTVLVNFVEKNGRFDKELETIFSDIKK